MSKMNSHKYLLINNVDLVHDIINDIKHILLDILIHECNPYDDRCTYELTDKDKECVTNSFCKEFNPKVVYRGSSCIKYYEIIPYTTYERIDMESIYSGNPPFSNLKYICNKMNTIPYDTSFTNHLCKAIYLIRVNEQQFHDVESSESSDW